MMPESVWAVIQARMDSSRLPGKVLLSLGSKSVLEVMHSRLEEVSDLDGVIVATTNRQIDVPIVEECRRLGIDVFEGTYLEVARRSIDAARTVGATHIVRLPGDKPCLLPSEVGRLIGHHRSLAADFTSNMAGLGKAPDRVPFGLEVEVFRTEALENAMKSLEFGARHQEHVTLYFWEFPQSFSVQFCPPSEIVRSMHEFRFNLDAREDFEFLEILFQNAGYLFDEASLSRFLLENPKLAQINAGVRQTVI